MERREGNGIGWKYITQREEKNGSVVGCWHLARPYWLSEDYRDGPMNFEYMYIIIFVIFYILKSLNDFFIFNVNKNIYIYFNN